MKKYINNEGLAIYDSIILLLIIYVSLVISCNNDSWHGRFSCLIAGTACRRQLGLHCTRVYVVIIVTAVARGMGLPLPSRPARSSGRGRTEAELRRRRKRQPTKSKRPFVFFS